MTVEFNPHAARARCAERHGKRREQTFPSRTHPARRPCATARHFSKLYRKPTRRGSGPGVSPLRWLAARCRIENKTHIVDRVRLSGLFVYPIKACGGIALEQAELAPRGLAFDRRYMLVDRAGTFISQREVPRLCLVATAFEGERLLVSTSGRATLELPRQAPPEVD